MIHAQQEEVKTTLQNFLHAFENCELSARNGSSLQIANRPEFIRTSLYLKSVLDSYWAN